MPDAPEAPAMSLEDACAALAVTTARVKTLGYVLQNDEATAKDVMAAVGLSRNAAGHHLAALTAAGLLHQRRVSQPLGGGPIIYWSADRIAIGRARDALSKHLS
ncbi:helix-turn-helix domain-containing protein [Clavibacter michiganensis]|uniref:helix-turn-helix domain-containing protein n=1 Tax=Clavibacter michiganensis TaxID=28447 RepID=UPI002931D822|nr:helix-turn-helix domain-containing protein [Clavibacter michiganensis]